MTSPYQPEPAAAERSAAAPQWQQPYDPRRPPGPKPTPLTKVLGAIPGVAWMYAGRTGLGITILAAWIVSPILFLFVVTGWWLFYPMVFIVLASISSQG